MYSLTDALNSLTEVAKTANEFIIHVQQATRHQITLTR